MKKELSEFRTTYEWCEYCGIDKNNIPQDRFHEWLELKRMIWDRHEKSLDPSIQKLLKEEKHPCFSWEFATEADKYAEELKHLLKDKEYVKDVYIGLYHGDTIVLTVAIDKNINWHQYGKDIPELFKGFEVKVAPIR